MKRYNHGLEFPGVTVVQKSSYINSWTLGHLTVQGTTDGINIDIVPASIVRQSNICLDTRTKNGPVLMKKHDEKRDEKDTEKIKQNYFTEEKIKSFSKAWKGRRRK